MLSIYLTCLDMIFLCPPGIVVELWSLSKFWYFLLLKVVLYFTFTMRQEAVTLSSDFFCSVHHSGLKTGTSAML